MLLVLFGLGALALWSGSEAVLPAYIAGMVLAEGGEGRSLDPPPADADRGFLTPFYFLRAGSLVSNPALVAAPHLPALLRRQGGLKIFGLYPFVGRFRRPQRALVLHADDVHGTDLRHDLGALGLSHGIVTREQYSFLVAMVIASAVVPTLIARPSSCRRIYWN